MATLALFLLTLTMTFWAPPALTLDMTAFKSRPESEAKSVQDRYAIYYLSYHSGNYDTSFHDLTDTQRLSAVFGTKNSSQLLETTLTNFLEDLKDRLRDSSRSASLYLALASSAGASHFTYVLINLTIINWFARLYVARRKGVGEQVSTR